MRAIRKLHRLIFSVVGATSFLLAGAHVQAQQPQRFADVPPPPVMDNLTEDAPSVTIQDREQQRPKDGITESRTPRGQVKDIVVTSSGSTYHVTPPQIDGPPLPNGRATVNTPATWRIKNFDMGKRPVPAPVPDNTVAPAKE